MYAQNPTNFPYGIKNTVGTENSTPTYFVTQQVDGVHKKTPAALFVKTAALSDSLDTRVPYTGALQNVNLGEYGVSGGYLKLDTTPTSIPTTLGTISWDATYRTASLIDGFGDTNLQIGQEQRILVHNGTGATIMDSQVVYVTGSTGDLPSIALANANSETTSARTIGVATESIPVGQDGFITISGMVHGIDTLAFNAGDLLWLSTTSGAFTNVAPISPNHLVLIGYVIKKSGGNGSILVKIQNTQGLSECSDVLFSALTNNDVLTYETSTGLWKNKSVSTAFGYTPANDANVVHKTGDETIAGIKTFTSNILVNGLTVGRGGSNLGTALGEFALASNTTGNSNTAIGSGAIGNNTSGGWNTGTGAGALDSNSTGNFNTGNGFNSLNRNTTGGYNSAHGVEAGSLIADKTTPATILNNSVMLGYRTSPLADNQTNQTVIGYDATGNGSNTVTIGNSSVTNNYFTGNVRGGAFIKSGGLSTEYLKADGSVSTLTNPITGTGTTNYLPKFTGSGTLGNSQVFDNGTNVLIGTTSVLSANYLSQINSSTGGLYISQQSNPSAIPFKIKFLANGVETYWDYGGSMFQNNAINLGTNNPIYFRNTINYVKSTAEYDLEIKAGNAINFSTQSYANTMTVKNSRVLINTPTDDGSNTLQVAGGTKITETSLAASGSLAGSALTVNQTWNTTGNPTAILANVTNTASGTSAKLMDLQVGGSSKFSVNKDGSAFATSINNVFLGFGGGNIGNNLAFGQYALAANSTGVNNLAIGFLSMESNSTGQGNIAIGRGSLQGKTTGSYNVAIGLLSGGGITTGSGNTILGANVTGLSSNLENNIILSNGTGAIKAQHDGTNWTLTGKVINTNTVRLKSYTVATLPAGTVGDMAYVTDALAPTYLGVLVGGGAVVTPAFYNGTNWVAH